MTGRFATSLGSERARAVARSLGQRVRARFVAAVSWLVCHLPEAFVVRVADLGGELWYRLTPERAALARRQLARIAIALEVRGAGPAKARAAARDPGALERLLRSAYRHSARYYVELMRAPRLGSRFFRERVLIETPDVVESAFADDSPIIFVGGHFGAIELPAVYLVARTGRMVTGPMETLPDPHLQAWFKRTREAIGIRVVTLEEARRELLATIRGGGSVGIVADRDITGGGVEVRLFGHPARLPVGPALLAIESGAPVYLAAIRRDGPGRYRATLRSIAVPTEGTRRERAVAIATQLAAGFEAVVAQAPDQWAAVFFPIWPDLAQPEPAPDAPTAQEEAA